MVSAYFDTGVLVKNYFAEANSAAAASLIHAESPPLIFTHFQELEARNSIRLKLFRGEITVVDAASSLDALRTDIRNGVLVRPSYSITSIFHLAEDLSHRFAAITGARALDILHVAAALEIGSKRFVSFDQRQRKVAAKAGLRVVPR